MPVEQISSLHYPRVLIVSRRSVRKNKFIDFVGEYHLDLIVGYGAIPIIVPRVSGIDKMLESLEPIHGVLLCEGEDIDPSLYNDPKSSNSSLSPRELEEVKSLHPSDTAIDKEKDSIELKLVKLCLKRGIPYLGICRGSQMLNVACGGTLYQDIDEELSKTVVCPQNEYQKVCHMNYNDYDGHRHAIKLVENTPLHGWFKDCLDHESREILVSSYHHQGVKKVANRFVPMAFAPDGLVEGFYDPDCYNPREGKFLVGLQFHPERMRKPDSIAFDYPGCSLVYAEFIKAVIAYQTKVSSLGFVPRPTIQPEKGKAFTRSVSLSKDMSNISYQSVHTPKKALGLEARAEFLEGGGNDVVLNSQQETRLVQMGATVRNSNLARLRLNEKEQVMARNAMRNMMSVV